MSCGSTVRCACAVGGYYVVSECVCVGGGGGGGGDVVFN